MMTTRQVAKILGLAPATLRQWRIRKKGPTYFKMERCIRYCSSDIEAWLQKVVAKIKAERL